MSTSAVATVDPRVVADAFRGDALELTVLPTEQCNFRCTYCYEDFAIGRMPPAVVAALAAFLEVRIPTLKRLGINWFGGEPLLAHDIVSTIGDLAIAACEAHGVAFSSSMTTNGYNLTSSVAERMVASGVSLFEVSLDGPPRQHDSSRVTRSGGATFERIWSNLQELRASELAIDVVLRLHLTPGNLAAMPDFVDEVRRTYLDDRRFRVLLFPVEELGGPNTGTFSVLAHDEALDAVAALQLQLRSPSTAESFYGSDYVCYAAKPNALMVRADGTLGKCTVALDDDRNRVGRLLADGTIESSTAAHAAWLRGWWEDDASALRCPLASLPDAIPAESLWMRPVDAPGRGGPPPTRAE